LKRGKHTREKKEREGDAADISFLSPPSALRFLEPPFPINDSDY
jgi:hypothetical protein